MSKHITIYTDGSYLPQANCGGWAAYIDSKSITTMLSGSDIGPTTNQRMEITAILEALKTIYVPSTIHIYSDSDYCVQAITKWIKVWKKNGWILKSTGKPVKNQDLFKELDLIMQPHKITISWVKAHADNEKNNLVDKTARDEARALIQ